MFLQVKDMSDLNMRFTDGNGHVAFHKILKDNDVEGASRVPGQKVKDMIANGSLQPTDCYLLSSVRDHFVSNALAMSCLWM